MKRLVARLMPICLLAALLCGCGLNDTLLYLYGGDEWVKADTPMYQTCHGDNGITVVYDANVWTTPTMAQEDTLSLTAGNQLNYTAVLLQVTDTYTDFLAQSGQELSETTGTVEYELDFTVPDAAVQAVRYDCGSYQSIFAQLDYDCGVTVYVSAATRAGDYAPILELLQNAWPTGHTPESARTDAPETALVNGVEREKSYA